MPAVGVVAAVDMTDIAGVAAGGIVPPDLSPLLLHLYLETPGPQTVVIGLSGFAVFAMQ